MKKTKLTLFATVLAAALFGMGCASSSLNKGLVAYYPFNGNAKDESGNALNGEPVGATLTVDRHGKANGAYIMNGVDYILLPKDKALDLQHHTLAAWVRNGDFDSRIEANSKKRTLWIVSRHLHNVALPYCLAISQPSNTDRVKGYQLQGINNKRLSVSFSRRPNFSNWKLLVATFDGKYGRLYLDGEPSGLLPFEVDGLLHHPDARVTIGSRWQGEKLIDCAIDDVRIYNRALSAEEVKALYDLEKPKVR